MPKECKWCGETLIRRPNERASKFNQRRFCCRSCVCNYGRQIQREKQSKFKKSNKKIAVTPKYSALGKSQTCKCPKCEQNHKKFMDWTGNGIPRVFCDNCHRSFEDRYTYLTMNTKQTREKVRYMFEKWDEQIMERQIIQYSDRDYSQEELRALVPSLK